MGLFDLFRKNDGLSSQERELQKLQKLTASKLSQDLDRSDALDRLAAMGTAPAARVLLLRFNWTLDPSIRDQEEKEVAVQGIAKAGESAIGEILSYCTKAEGVTWPLKALRRIVSAERFEDEVISLLEKFDTDYQRNPEPKIQLLQLLEEFSSPRARQAATPFLQDSSEAVRFAAVNAVFRIDDGTSVVPLLQALGSDESLRVKNRIAQGLVEKAWEIPAEQRDPLTTQLPPGFSLQAGRVAGASRA